MPQAPYITNAFQPAPGLGNPHAQTLGAYLLRRGALPPLRRERWDTPDADFVDVDLVDARADKPHVLVLHGLEGSSRAGYVAEVLRGAHRRGWGAAALNFRSCSGELNRQLSGYNSGDTRDVAFAIERLRRRGLEGPLYGIGFSLGGNVLLNLLAETGAKSPLQAAAAISVPYDLQACARLLDTQEGIGRIYRTVFLASLKRKITLKARRHPEAPLDLGRIRRAEGIEAFDDLVTAPLHGYRDANEYYARCSSGPKLEAIATPTLLLTADDDPLVPATSFPEEVAARNPHLTVVRTPRGGHVGFVAGTPRKPRFWAEDQALSFFEQQALHSAERE